MGFFICLFSLDLKDILITHHSDIWSLGRFRVGTFASAMGMDLLMRGWSSRWGEWKSDDLDQKWQGSMGGIWLMQTSLDGK